MMKLIKTLKDTYCIYLTSINTSNGTTGNGTSGVRVRGIVYGFAVYLVSTKPVWVFVVVNNDTSRLMAMPASLYATDHG